MTHSLKARLKYTKQESLKCNLYNGSMGDAECPMAYHMMRHQLFSARMSGIFGVTFHYKKEDNNGADDGDTTDENHLLMNGSARLCYERGQIEVSNAIATRVWNRIQLLNVQFVHMLTWVGISVNKFHLER